MGACAPCIPLPTGLSTCFIIVIQSYNCLPEHCVPSPAKPGLHVHVWEPKVLAQLAFLSHLCFPVLHSSISKDKCVCMCDISAL